MQDLVIYFEEDVEQTHDVIEFFSQQDLLVLHYSALPEGGVNQLNNEIATAPFIVLMDINVQEHCGFDLCAQLKQQSLFSSVPILFLSESDGEKHVLMAYEAGAFDYLVKPLHISSLKAKCNALKELREQHYALQSQVDVSEQMAFDAMIASSDLGNILRYHDKIAEHETLDALALSVIEFLGTTGISASIMYGVNTDNPIYFSDDGNEYILEQKVYQTLSKQGRIYSWKNRTLYNYDTFSVLIRTMPIDDEAKYGTLKDQLSMLLNGVEVRVKGIINESKLKRSEENVRYLAHTIGKMALDMQNSNRELSSQFERLITEMEVDLCEDLANLSLLAHEEQKVMTHIKEALANASDIFETEKQKEAAMAEVLLHLVEQLDN